jgi:hypothetical protein
MTPVDAKVGIEREHFSGLVEFREPNHAGVGKRHGPATIAMHKCPQVGLLFPDVECDGDCASLQKSKERISFKSFAF